MASSSKPTAVHFALIFFVMISVISSVVAYMMYQANMETEAARAKAADDFQKLRNVNLKRDEEITELKKVIGYPGLPVGVDDPQNGNTVLAAARTEMSQLGGPLAEATYSATLTKMRQEINNAVVQRDALNDDIEGALDQNTNQRTGGLKQTVLALRGQYATERDQFDSAAKKSEADKRTVITSMDEAIRNKDNEVNKLRNDLNTIRQQLDAEREQFAIAVKEKDDKLKQFSDINDRLREEIDTIRTVSFERPDGVVRWVDYQAKTIWVNLGEADSLPVRTNFSVYQKAHHGIGRGAEDIKGAIEITRILGPHLSEARILESEIYAPIAAGDPIYTPLWDPGRTETFSFVGVIDFDGDGLSDRESLHDLVKSANATIDNEVDEQGVRHGDGITAETKFLVVGELPDPSTAKPNDQERFTKISKEYKKIHDEARVKGVRIVRLNDFLAYIGYKPSRRLWRPGQEVPWKLKAGSHSTGVNESMSNRESSGQTSGVFSRSKRLKQPTSTGQTSKSFGGGYGGN